MIPSPLTQVRAHLGFPALSGSVKFDMGMLEERWRAKLSGVICLAGIGAGQLFADEERSLYDLSIRELLDVRIVEAASGYSQSVTDAPASVSIVSAEEWRTTGARSLNDVLRPLAGVHVSKTQTAATINKVGLRGLSGPFGQQVVYLIDGEPINRIRDGGLLPGQRFGLIGLKQVEVVKGPGSVVYGADAMGGVINMVRYEPGEAPRTFEARTGSFDTFEFGGVDHWDIGESVLQIAFSYQKTNDDPDKTVESDLQTNFDQMFGTNASRAPGRFDESYEISTIDAQWKWNDLKVSVYDWNNRRSGLGAGIAQAIDPEGFSEMHSTSVNAAYDLSRYVEGEMTLAANWRETCSETLLHVFPAGTRLPIGRDGNIDFRNPVSMVDFTDGYIGTPGAENRYYDTSLAHVFEGNDGHRFRYEIGVSKYVYHANETKNFGPGVIDGSQTPIDGTLSSVTGTEFVYMPDKDRSLFYAALSDSWKVSSRLQADVGLRFDQYSDFGDSWNPRASLSWSASPDFEFKLYGGTGFRAPSFVDLYSANNPTGLGNPSLKPERIRSLDTGLNVSYLGIDNLSLNANVFGYTLDNIIQFVAQPESGIQVAQNIGVQRARGVELSANWRGWRRVSVDLSYSALDSENERGETTPDIPRQLGYLGWVWFPNDHWRFHLGGKWVADRVRSVKDKREALDDYLWSTLRLQYTKDRLEIGLTFENALNEDAREPSNGSIANDYPLAGREVLLDLAWSY